MWVKASKALNALMSSTKSKTTRHKLRRYPVQAATTGGVTNKIFTGDVKTSMVCKLIQEESGRRVPDPGCADAAAFTYWPSPDMKANTVYLPDGRKDPKAPWNNVIIEVRTTLPEHVGPPPKGLHGADIKRFLARLAMHERGHGSTGEQLLASSKAFLNSLPDKVSKEDVQPLNQAVLSTLSAMLSLARWADRVFDEVTIHGTTSGSIANDTPTPTQVPGLGL